MHIEAIFYANIQAFSTRKTALRRLCIDIVIGVENEQA